MELTPEELRRYNRQIIIPEIGEQGQQKLKAAKIMVAGLGGLGSISAYYLAAAGVGHLTLVDKDFVECSNLNRQILHWTQDMGQEKTRSAVWKLQKLNPNCTIRAVQAEITEDNCRDLIGDCDMIVDGMDNMKTRRVLNAACLNYHIPYIYGGVYHMEGVASVFIPGKTPCLECVFPADPDETETSASGILGPVPGVISCIQSMEAIKLILGLTDLLAGRLLFFCGYDMRFQEFKIDRNPCCCACGRP